MANTRDLVRNGAVGFIDPLSWLTKVELVVEAGQIRAGLLDNAFREWRKLCSGKRPAGRLFCPPIMAARDNLHVVGMALSVELECTSHGHAMNAFRMLHELCKHDSTSDVSGLKCIRSPDGIAVCCVRMGWPELHRRDRKQSYDRLSTHGSNENQTATCNPFLPPSQIRILLGTDPELDIAPAPLQFVPDHAKE